MAAYLQARRTDETDSVLATSHDGSTLARRLTDKYGDRVATAFTVFGREGSFVPLPADLPAGLSKALTARGIERLYSHQQDAWEAARAGHNVLVSTPTASGKTLCYTLPVVASVLEAGAKALYLFPPRRWRRTRWPSCWSSTRPADSA
jgi:DEAD/DEAH box helicase domain-containing protein